jgi:hypothetical protein
MICRTVDYGLDVLFLTPQFVLIRALAEPGSGDLGLLWLRAINSVLGGLLAPVALRLHRGQSSVASRAHHASAA